MMFLIFVFLGFSTSSVVTKSNDVQLFCPGHNPQRSLDINLILGDWYAVEIVEHMAHEGLRHLHNVQIDICPKITLRLDDLSNIRVIWQEDGITVFYYAKRTDVHSPGFWSASGPHAEYLAEHERRHPTPTGTIEVMKAVNNHIVLTFCKSNQADSHLFTAVLAREPYLSRAEMHGVNRMLTHRKLQSKLIKRTCSSAGTAILSIASLVLVLIPSLI